MSRSVMLRIDLRFSRLFSLIDPVSSDFAIPVLEFVWTSELNKGTLMAPGFKMFPRKPLLLSSKKTSSSSSTSLGPFSLWIVTPALVSLPINGPSKSLVDLTLSRSSTRMMKLVVRSTKGHILVQTEKTVRNWSVLLWPALYRLLTNRDVFRKKTRFFGDFSQNGGLLNPKHWSAKIILRC